MLKHDHRPACSKFVKYQLVKSSAGLLAIPEADDAEGSESVVSSPAHVAANKEPIPDYGRWGMGRGLDGD